MVASSRLYTERIQSGHTRKRGFQIEGHASFDVQNIYRKCYAKARGLQSEGHALPYVQIQYRMAIKGKRFPSGEHVINCHQNHYRKSHTNENVSNRRADLSIYTVDTKNLCGRKGHPILKISKARVFKKSFPLQSCAHFSHAWLEKRPI